MKGTIPTVNNSRHCNILGATQGWNIEYILTMFLYESTDPSFPFIPSSAGCQFEKG